MKKLYFIATIALALTACTSEEDMLVSTPTAPQEINLKAVNYVLSRNAASDAASPTFGTDNVMYVAANYKTTGAYASYFNGKKFTHKDSYTDLATGNTVNGDVWTASSEMLYFPTSGTMQFMAYSTDAKHYATWDNENYKCTVDFDKDVDGTTATTGLDGTEDVLYSRLSSEVTCGRTTAPTNLLFKHALAWVKVQLKDGDTGVDAKNNKIYVYDVRINNVSLSGKAAFTFDDNNTSVSVAWDTPLTQTKEALSLTPQTGFKAGASVTPDKNGMKVISTATDWGDGLLVPTQVGTSITIDYTIINGTTESAKMSYTYTVPSTTWTAGSLYTYIFNIKLNEIKVTGSVNAFTNVTGGTAEL